VSHQFFFRAPKERLSTPSPVPSLFCLNALSGFSALRSHLGHKCGDILLGRRLKSLLNKYEEGIANHCTQKGKNASCKTVKMHYAFGGAMPGTVLVGTCKVLQCRSSLNGFGPPESFQTCHDSRIYILQMSVSFHASCSKMSKDVLCVFELGTMPGINFCSFPRWAWR
jgi:hypothetical protein